jgi:hypothetical protein
MIQQGTDGLSRGYNNGPATSGVALNGMLMGVCYLEIVLKLGNSYLAQ